MDLTGKTFHHYQIIELVGHGGMAEVYKAYHATLDCFVAVKILYPHLATQESFLRRFQQEARAIARLHHPNIVRVQDFGVEKDLVYMVMEFVEGPSLQSCLEEAARRGEYWSLEDVLYLLHRVGSAIDYAHQQGMIHRDIKPANILLRTGRPETKQQGGGYTLAPAGTPPILTDFGLAHLLGETHRSVTGSLTGTLAYMSPEQVLGERGGKASDLYSLGLVLYEMLTHRIPFVADTPSGMIFKRVHEAPPPLRELRPDVSKEIEAVVMKALSKAPEDRYPMASALAKAFEEAAKSSDTLHPSSLPSTVEETISFEPGDVVGEQFEVLEILGEGGFSRVFKVCDVVTGDIAALKVVSDSSGALDLRQEFQTLRTLDHPSIAKVYETGLLPNYLYYLKLEYVEGYTLQECIDRGMLTLGKAVELVGDVLEALSYLEGRGYIHRDIKPSNIVVTATGAKIIDFNVSKRLEDSSMTQIGTPRYMPPEVPVFGWNRTCDVFSAGLVFYEMTTGRFPFVDPAAYAAWEIPHPCELNPALPSALADIILKALARAPNDRFQSAAEMLQAVRNVSFRQEEWSTVMVRPPSAVSLKGKPTAFRRKVLFDAGRLRPIVPGDIGRLSQLRCFGSGIPVALGSRIGGSEPLVVTTAGVYIVEPENGSWRKLIGAPESAWIIADVSPQGNVLAAVDRSRNLHVHDLRTGQLLGNIVNLQFAPASVACGNNGRFVALFSRADRQVYLWDRQLSRFVAQWGGTSGPVALSPDESTFAILTQDGEVVLWRIGPGEEIVRFDVSGDHVTEMAFNSDGELLVTAGRTTRLWQVSAGHQMTQWSMEAGRVNAAMFAPDNRWVALASTLASDVARVELREISTGQRLADWKLDRVGDLAVASDGETVHVIESRASVCSYSVCSRHRTRKLDREPGYLCASLSADGLMVAAGNTDGSVFLWNTHGVSSSEQRPWRKEKAPVWGVALDPNGQKLVIAASGHVDLYDIQRSRCLWRARVRNQRGDVFFSPDGRLVVVYQPGITSLYEVATGKRVKRIRSEVVAVAPAGQAMAVVYKGGVCFFDLFTMKSTRKHTIPDCKYLALGGRARALALFTSRNALEIWHVRGGRDLTVLSKLMLGTSEPDAQMNALALGADGLLLASSGNDGIVRLWDGSTGIVRRALTAHLSPVTSASFSADGRVFCTASLDGTVRLWGVLGTR